MNETLQEFFDWRGAAVRVDRQAGVIHGVKILGLESRNGRSYLPEALARAVPLYEGAKVNVNHPKAAPSAPRDYQDRLGTIRGVTLRPEEGLFAELHFNPRHALAEQLLWDAEHAPENVGLSHHVEAQTARRGERVAVEAITRVVSVDLVADPATTRGLFEGAGGAEAVPALAGISVEELRRARPDLVEALLREVGTETAQLREEIARRDSQEAALRRAEAARRVLRAFRLPEPEAADARGRAIVGPRFFEQLLAAPDEAAMRVLVEERARLVESLQGRPGPVSREQGGAEPLDAKSFVAAIT